MRRPQIVQNHPNPLNPREIRRFGGIVGMWTILLNFSQSSPRLPRSPGVVGVLWDLGAEWGAPKPYQSPNTPKTAKTPRTPKTPGRITIKTVTLSSRLIPPFEQRTQRGRCPVEHGRISVRPNQQTNKLTSERPSRASALPRTWNPHPQGPEPLHPFL